MIPLFRIDNLSEAIFINRPNRFVAEIKIRGRIETAHIHDLGRLKELLVQGAKLLITPMNPKAKLSWYVKAVEHEEQWVIIDTALHSKIARKLFPLIDEFKNYNVIKSEVTLDNPKAKKKSRIDFTLDNIPLEVKGVSLVKEKIALFPDAPTERGRRHVEEIIHHKGMILFLIFKNAEKFLPNVEMDIKFSNALSRAKSMGILIICAQILFDGSEVFYNGKVSLAEF